MWIHDITLGRNRGTKLQFSWYGPVFITKVLDRGCAVVRQKQDKPLMVVHVDRLEAYADHAGPEIYVNSRIASRQIAIGNAGPTSTLISMGVSKYWS